MEFQTVHHWRQDTIPQLHFTPDLQTCRIHAITLPARSYQKPWSYKAMHCPPFILESWNYTKKYSMAGLPVSPLFSLRGFPTDHHFNSQIRISTIYWCFHLFSDFRPSVVSHNISNTCPCQILHSFSETQLCRTGLLWIHYRQVLQIWISCRSEWLI